MHAGTNDSTRSINTLKTVKKTEVKPNARLIFVQLNTRKTHKRYFKKRYPMLMVVWRITAPRKNSIFWLPWYHRRPPRGEEFTLKQNGKCHVKTSGKTSASWEATCGGLLWGHLWRAPVTLIYVTRNRFYAVHKTIIKIICSITQWPECAKKNVRYILRILRNFFDIRRLQQSIQSNLHEGFLWFLLFEESC